jgi:hypothetical protein
MEVIDPSTVPADTFVFSGSDDRRFLSSISPVSFSLGTNETREVTVTANAGKRGARDVRHFDCYSSR